ncbi:MAG: hypothetical protein NC192_12725 [Muribaculaceae bacterium]|nr:hypothetical protein [Muribaculaceae bacterium]
MKQIILFLLAVTLTFSLCCCGKQSAKLDETSEQQITEESTVPTISIEAYSERASKLNEDIYEASVIISNCGKYINSYWKTLENIGGTFKEESAIQSADEWLKKNSDESMDSIASAYKDIAELYKEVLRANISDPVATQITEKLISMYDLYCEFYSLVTNLSGSRNDFASTYNKCSKGIASEYESIKALLE